MKREYSRAAQSAAAFVLCALLMLQVCANEPAVAETVSKSPKVVSDNQPNSDETPKVKGHQLYLSLGDKFNAPLYSPAEIFDCQDKIYSVVELENYALGKHHLAVLWSDPSGTVRENTQYDFQVRRKDTRLWAWLSLSRGFGSGMLQWANPAAGLEEFI
ncbi:MAG: hypothetical protein KTR16_10620, partial [Acidiferrobacterales bacterium]|nr:hypothetical protein [Acidiferrobacterales bacterium]